MAVPALIVDNDQPFAQRLGAELAQLGYRAEFASTKADAMAIATTSLPALVIAELRIGQESGLALFEELRLSGVEVRFAIVTAFSAIASAVEATRLGVAAYLAKPVSAANILDAVNGARNRASAAQAAAYCSLDRAKWEYINLTVASSGSISEAARRLRVERRSLRRMLAKCPPAR